MFDCRLGGFGTVLLILYLRGKRKEIKKTLGTAPKPPRNWEETTTNNEKYDLTFL